MHHWIKILRINLNTINKVNLTVRFTRMVVCAILERLVVV